MLPTWSRSLALSRQPSEIYGWWNDLFWASRIASFHLKKIGLSRDSRMLCESTCRWSQNVFTESWFEHFSGMFLSHFMTMNEWTPRTISNVDVKLFQYFWSSWSAFETRSGPRVACRPMFDPRLVFSERASELESTFYCRNDPKVTCLEGWGGCATGCVWSVQRYPAELSTGGGPDTQTLPASPPLFSQTMPEPHEWTNCTNCLSSHGMLWKRVKVGWTFNIWFDIRS